MATAPLSLLSFPQPSSAAALQTQLKAAEQRLDLALADTGELIGKTLRAAEEAGLHRTAIQRMLLRAHSAIGHGLKAQWDLQIFHQSSRDLLDTLDLQELGWGDIDSPKGSPSVIAATEAEAVA